MKTILHHRIFVIAWSAFALFLMSCERQAPVRDALEKEASLQLYSHEGLEIAYPAGWSLLHDEAGIVADRTVAFETPNVSRITVYLYKSKPRSFSDLANNLVQQLSLDTSEDVKHFQREVTEIAGYKGVRLNWINFGLSEIQNEVTILQLRHEPYPVFVQFQMFDSDIASQSANLSLFLNGISFDPQGVKL